MKEKLTRLSGGGRAQEVLQLQQQADALQTLGGSGSLSRTNMLYGVSMSAGRLGAPSLP